MKNKLLLILIITCLSILSLNAQDSESLSSMVTAISSGPNGFGWDTAPAGTSFIFYDYFRFSPHINHSAYFKLAFSFKYLTHEEGGYNFYTGTPKWFLPYYKTNNNPEYKTFTYFYPTSYIDIYLSQGFFSNPIYPDAPLLELSIGLFSDYAMAVENTFISQDTHPLFVDEHGNPKSPFGPDQWIQGYPWLSDDRITWFNYLYFSSNINITKPIGFQAYDGITMNFGMDMGPKWFFNTYSGEFPSSNFYTFKASITEYLTLYNKTQSNGYNWLNIVLNHSNSISTTIGDIIPYPMMQGDRLNNYFGDRLSIQINGPQFFSSDCYSYINLSLYNTLRWGHIENEYPRTTKALEYTSSFTTTFYLRLFGFMRFEYYLGYNFTDGIKANFPYWYHRATISVYIQI